MRIFPKKFNLDIFGKKTKVEVVKDFAKNEGLLGLFIPDQDKIIIAQDQIKEEAAKTLVHEIWHSIEFRTGLRQVIPKEVSELIAEGISIAICENFNLSLKGNKK